MTAPDRREWLRSQELWHMNRWWSIGGPASHWHLEQAEWYRRRLGKVRADGNAASVVKKIPTPRRFDR